MIKKKSIFVICILLIILSFTGCLNRNAITEAETEERIPAFISKMESVLTNYKMNDDLRIDYSNESNDFPAFISVSDNKRKYHISVFIYNIECAEKFKVTLQWSPKIENGKPVPEDIFAVEDVTLQMYSDLIFEFSNNQVHNILPNYLTNAKDVILKKDLINNRMTPQDYYTDYKNLRAYGLGMQCKMSGNYWQVLSVEGGTKEDI